MLNQSKPFLGKDTVIHYTVIQLYSLILKGIVSTIYGIINIYIFIYILIIKYFQKNGGSKNKLYNCITV